MSGYIKIDRKIFDWEWWSDINTYRLFTYMILKANWKSGNFNGIEIPRGSFVSSLSKLSEATNLTISEVRTALKHLLATGEVTIASNNKFTIYTVNNYCLYQNPESQIRENINADSKFSGELILISDDLIRKYWGRCSTDADIENVYGLITLYDGEKTTIDSEKLKLLEYSFENSAQANAMNWNYINGIMKRLRSRGIVTLDDAYTFDVIRDMQKNIN